jgi:hypothetical protein
MSRRTIKLDQKLIYRGKFKDGKLHGGGFVIYDMAQSDNNSKKTFTEKR